MMKMDFFFTIAIVRHNDWIKLKCRNTVQNQISKKLLVSAWWFSADVIHYSFMKLIAYSGCQLQLDEIIRELVIK